MKVQLNGEENSNCIKSTTTDKPTILVVEDDDDTRDFVVRALNAEALHCVAASSVAEAISVLERERVTVTVLDWGLDRSGAEVLRVAKELYPSMPVLVMSGLPFDVRTDAVVAQADAFLDKPFSATVLINQVGQAIQRIKRTPAIPLPQRAEDICSLDEIKSLYIQHVVELLDGHICRAAEALQIHRQTVSAVLKKQAVRIESSSTSNLKSGLEPMAQP